MKQRQRTEEDGPPEPFRKVRKLRSSAAPGKHSESGTGGSVRGVCKQRSIIFEVISCPDLFSHISTFQPGRRYVQWYSGNKAVACGHESLLKLKRREEKAARSQRPDSSLKRSVPLYFTRSALSAAASKGNLKLLQWVHRHPLAEEKAFFAALFKDSGKVLQLAQTVNVYRQDLQEATLRLFELATSEGHLDLILWLETEYPSVKPSNAVLLFAVGKANPDVLRWLCRRAEPFSNEQLDSLLHEAIVKENVEALRWLDETYTPYPDGEARWPLIRALNEGSSLKIVRWVTERYGPRQLFSDSLEESELDDALQEATQQGQFEVLTWLYEHGRYSAVIRGKVKWIVQAGLAGGDPRIVTWAETVTGQTLEDLHLDALRCIDGYLSGGLMEETLSFLQWAHQRYPQHTSVWANSFLVHTAFEEKDTSLLQWLHSLKVMSDEEFFPEVDGDDLLDRFTSEQDIPFLRWVHQVRPQLFQPANPSKEDIIWIASQPHNEVLLRLVEELWKVNVASMMDAKAALARAVMGNTPIDTLRYLQKLIDNEERKGSSSSSIASKESGGPRDGASGGIPKKSRRDDDAWKKGVVLRAVEKGSLLTVELLSEHGYDISCAKALVSHLIPTGRLDVLAFLLSNKVLEVTVHMLKLAKSSKDWPLLHWLAKQASPSVYQKFVSSLTS